MYVAIWKDRHCDTTVHLFSNKDPAIIWAIEKAKEYCRFEEDYEEVYYDQIDNNDWIFTATYSCEDDGITIMKCEIDKDVR